MPRQPPRCRGARSDRRHSAFLARCRPDRRSARKLPAPEPCAYVFPASHVARRRPSGRINAAKIEVLRLVSQGATNRQIGVALHISERTVNTHLTNILNKIGCNNRTAAAAFALQHGLV